MDGRECGQGKEYIGDKVVHPALGELVTAIIDVVAEAHPYWKRGMAGPGVSHSLIIVLHPLPVRSLARFWAIDGEGARNRRGAAPRTRILLPLFAGGESEEVG